jgi:hypothetical protein
VSGCCRNYCPDKSGIGVRISWNSHLELKNRSFGIRLGAPFGFSGIGRTLMRDVNYMLSMYDNPKLLKEIIVKTRIKKEYN